MSENQEKDITEAIFKKVGEKHISKTEENMLPHKFKKKYKP